MNNLIFAEQNARIIPLEDKIFGISRLAKERAKEKGHEAVINASLGSLLDDDGHLVILSSVVNAVKSLAAVDYADYAPIGGTPEFKKAIQSAAFRAFHPNSHTEVIATPGGTGALRNTISNYSKLGDTVLTTDWHWAPYNTIAQEIGRKIETFTLFDEAGKFNVASLDQKVKALAQTQERLILLLNTPAHNPTGHTMTPEEWDLTLHSVKEVAAAGKKVTILVDAAYIDFAGDAAESRQFLPKLDDLPESILVVVAYSLSKTFTLYGMRCGAAIAMTKSKAIADEFKRVCEFSSRGSWSNCTRPAMTVLANVYADPVLLAQVDREREVYRNMLRSRGRAFEDAARQAGLPIVPYDAGFFASIPCATADVVSEKLQKDDIFLVPFAKGLRVTVAAISEEKCKAIPEKVLQAMQ